MRIIYNGSVQSVIVPLLEGGKLEAKRGEPFEVEDSIGHRLVGEGSIWAYADEETNVDTNIDTKAKPKRGTSKKETI
jgi:hypothetical protein